ncbi:MAG: hypothetical protein KQJ78_06465 [Deltaproteobacteria bacterium]|nr:hypothetical protein [Deltaproteobacteria bacterium]
MKYFKLFCIVLLGFLLAACTQLKYAKLALPECFGMTRLANDIYIEKGADQATKDRLLAARELARKQIAAAYGEVQSTPTVYACITEECFQSFGGVTARAKNIGGRLLLSPRGLNWHYLAHEWSHDELYTRLGFWTWHRQMPQWFDEGLAVAISQAPEHSESHWQALAAAGVPRPGREELRASVSLQDWQALVRRYGVLQNEERRARGELEIHPVYAAAGHEVRPWLAQAGQAGLLELLQRLKEGESFAVAYAPAAPAE